MLHVLESYCLCTLNGVATGAGVSSVFYDAKEGLYDVQRGKAKGLKGLFFAMQSHWIHFRTYSDSSTILILVCLPTECEIGASASSDIFVL
ncbi:hypothetical protein E4U14_000994 [Claviceps sp. LM454 group G7]|nr:hypothetical protein E4U14_000994 [Claviceps sp. LM454 group G7]